MAESRHLSIRTDKFRVHYEAMRGLAAKTLPAESETKLALLVKSYEKVFDATTAALKKNEDTNGQKRGHRVILTPVGEARRDRIAATQIMVKLPPKDCLIKKSDLPKLDDAAEKDMENRNGTAWLVSQLGPFYDHEVSGEKKEMLETELDAESLAALEAANVDDIPVRDLPADTEATAVLGQRMDVRSGEASPGK